MQGLDNKPNKLDEEQTMLDTQTTEQRQSTDRRATEENRNTATLTYKNCKNIAQAQQTKKNNTYDNIPTKQQQQ